MGDIEELQRRLSSAMDRVAKALETRGESASVSAALRVELDEERLANAQLRERVQALKSRSAAEAEATRAMEARMEALDRSLQQLRQAGETLRTSNAALRAANAEGVGDAALINAGLEAELEALRAERAADRAENDAILAALGAVLDEEKRQGNQADA